MGAEVEVDVISTDLSVPSTRVWSQVIGGVRTKRVRAGSCAGHTWSATSRVSPFGEMRRHASPAGDWLNASGDRKSTRLNSSHVAVSYAVFCLQKKMT